MCHDCQDPTHKEAWYQKVLGRRQLMGAGVGAAIVVSVGGINIIRINQASAASGPAIASADTWGAQPPRGAITVLPHKPNKILVHHTTDPNVTDFSREHAYAIARSIQQSHFSRGWIDSGQQFTISRGGYIMEGRHRSLEALQSGTQHVLGAHCVGQNEEALGIENEGIYTSTLPPDALWNSLVNMCVYVCQQYGLQANAIFGHRDFDNTECPGVQLYGQLPKLRKQVATRLGQHLPARTWPVYKNGSGGESVKSVQYLLRAHGSSLSTDGVFGSGTESAVRGFQSAHGLTADGVVGQHTWEALVSTVRNGSSGDAVRAVQSQLHWKGYGASVDGQFGSGTENAVKQFQTNQGLTADGVVSLSTWCALVGGAVGG